MRWAGEDRFNAEFARAARGEPRRVAILKAITAVESAFNPGAIGDDGSSFGLTQLHLPTLRGLGYTGDPSLLADPAAGVPLALAWSMRLLEELEEQLGPSNFAELFSAWNCGARRTVGTATGWSSRCRKSAGGYVNQDYVDRAMSAYRYFAGLDDGTPPVPPTLPSLPGGIPPSLVALLVVVGVAALLWLRGGL